MPIPSTTTALPRSLAREDVYRTIKDWIVHLQLAPGELIRDQELAAHLGVSRTPVREALRRLEDEGLIVTSLHKWTKVAPSEIGEAEQLYPAVAALEAMATELAQPHLSTADLKQLSAINKAMEQAVKQHDAAQAAAHDMEFHALIVQRSNNTEIEKLLAALLPRIKRIELAHFGSQPIAQQSVKEHRAIIDALKKGDGKQAAEVVKANWLLAPASDAHTKPAPSRSKTRTASSSSKR